MAATMTNVSVPVSDGASAIWTSLYTAAGTVTLNVHNRSHNVQLLVRVNGASTAAGDSADAAAELLQCGATMAIALVSGDKVFAKPFDDRTGVSGRATIRV